MKRIRHSILLIALSLLSLPMVLFADMEPKGIDAANEP